jgi:ribulose-phosphate 3-epimerase
MNRKLRIAPSILSADFSRLGEDVRRAEAAGADWIHVDVMDGHFVPNITIGPLVVEAVRRSTELPVDVHLMIETPERYVQDFADAGADLITVHSEACPHLNRVIASIREAGARPGVAINPGTPVEMLTDVLPLVDLILVMTVNPGFGGQSFIPRSVDKLARLEQMLLREGLSGAVDVQVDGGISETTAPRVVGAGANVLVAGSALFRAPDGVESAIARLRSAAESVGRVSA